MRKIAFLAAAAAILVPAAPSFAQQASDIGWARGVVLQSLTLSKVEDLDFGIVAPDALTAGTVSVDADTGVRSTTGGVVALPGRPVTRAEFDGFGTAGQQVQLTLNQPAGGVITSGGGAFSIPATLNLDAGPTLRTIPAGGQFSVFVGGDFAIAANQHSGLYEAQFDLTADYQ
jgi:hypothetical protein